jgi:hypothetical protein
MHFKVTQTASRPDFHLTFPGNRKNTSSTFDDDDDNDDDDNDDDDSAINKNVGNAEIDTMNPAAPAAFRFGLTPTAARC